MKPESDVGFQPKPILGIFSTGTYREQIATKFLKLFQADNKSLNKESKYNKGFKCSTF